MSTASRARRIHGDEGRAAACLALALLGIALGTGCRREPGEEDARRWFAQHRATLDRIEHGLRLALDDFPYAGERFRCENDAGARDPEAARERCLESFHRWDAASRSSLASFYGRTGRAFLLLDGVKGVHIVVDRREPLAPAALGELSGSDAPPTSWITGCGRGFRADRRGSVSPSDGVVIDGHRVGWGLGQLAFDAGPLGRYDDDACYPQIDVAWEITHGPVRAEIEVNLLAERSVPPDWRRSQIAICSARFRGPER